MVAKVLVIGASGRVGSQVVKELDHNSDGVAVRLATSQTAVAEKWRNEGREAVVMNLDEPETFVDALSGVERVFLLTGYTSDMLRQSKMFVDAAHDTGVSHVVHLGVFTSRRDLIPHFIWHDLIETYIEASGMAWTHLHPNVIADTTFVTNPSLAEMGSFNVPWGEGDVKQGWVWAADIAAVAAEVLREGPEKHGGANYWLSTEVLSGPEIADIFTAAAGREIKCIAADPSALEASVATIPTVSVRSYMESAVVTIKLAAADQMQAQTVVRDDVLTVLGRPGMTMMEWARQYFDEHR